MLQLQHHANIKANEDDIPGAWVCPECAEVTADGREVVGVNLATNSVTLLALDL